MNKDVIILERDAASKERKTPTQNPTGYKSEKKVNSPVLSLLWAGPVQTGPGRADGL